MLLSVGLGVLCYVDCLNFLSLLTNGFGGSNIKNLAAWGGKYEHYMLNSTVLPERINMICELHCFVAT